MIRPHEQNLSPYIALETARYLTDPLLLQEYVEIQQGPISLFDQLWKKPKFRLFVLRCSRLLLITMLATAMFSTINQMGRWNDIYFWLLRLL